MRATLYAIAASLLLALAGCSTVSVWNSSAGENVDRLINSKRFDEALHVIESLPVDHPEYSALQDEKRLVEKLKAEYIEETLEQARTLENEDSWQLAMMLYEEAVSALPANEDLAAAHDDFLARRDQFVAKHQLELNKMRARALLEQGPVYEQIADALPRAKDWQRTLEAKQRERETVAAVLGSHGYELLDSGDMPAAVEYLALANALDPRENRSQTLADVRAQIEAKQQKVRNRKKSIARRQQTQRKEQRIAKEQRAYEQSWALYNEAMATESYGEARLHLQDCISRRSDDPQLVEAMAELENTIALQVREGIARGKRFYAAGYLDEALDVWRSALQLEPANEELQNRIQRAERFKARFEALNKS